MVRGLGILPDEGQFPIDHIAVGTQDRIEDGLLREFGSVTKGGEQTPSDPDLNRLSLRNGAHFDFRGFARRYQQTAHADRRPTPMPVH